MYKIERVTMIKRIDDDGELVPDVESDFFVKFTKTGDPVFDYDFRAKEYSTKEEAEQVIDKLKPLYDNSKNRFVRRYLTIQEVRAA